jgi:hypothetical protein
MSKSLFVAIALIAITVPASAQLKFEVAGARTAADGVFWIQAGSQVSLTVSGAQPGDLVVFMLKDIGSFDHGLADKRGTMSRQYDIAKQIKPLKFEAFAMTHNPLAEVAISKTHRFQLSNRATEAGQSRDAIAGPADGKVAVKPADGNVGPKLDLYAGSQAGRSRSAIDGPADGKVAVKPADGNVGPKLDLYAGSQAGRSRSAIDAPADAKAPLKPADGNVGPKLDLYAGSQAGRSQNGVSAPADAKAPRKPADGNVGPKLDLYAGS